MALLVANLHRSGSGGGGTASIATLTPSARAHGSSAPSSRHIALVALTAVALTLAFGVGSASAAAPLIKPLAAGPVHSEQAELNGQVNPQGSLTTYWFEWGSADCASSSCTSTPHTQAGVNELQQVIVHASAGQFTLSFAGHTTANLSFNASPAAVQGALAALSSIGAGNVSVTGGRTSEDTHYRVTFRGNLAGTNVEEMTGASGTVPLTSNQGTEAGSAEVTNLSQGSHGGVFLFVSESLTGLSPETTYHFRLVAQTGSETANGPDETFTTPAPEPSCPNAGALGTSVLPNCRAWEMVSPPDKNGGDIPVSTSSTFAAAEGGAVAFNSLVAFGEGLQGTGSISTYIARRTGQTKTGWSSHSIFPKQESLNFFQIALANVFPSFQDFSPDLSKAVMSSMAALTSAPNVETSANLYTRSGILDGPGSDELLTDSTTPLPTTGTPILDELFLKPTFVAASEDLSHVEFMSKAPLTGDTKAGEIGERKLFEHGPEGVRLVGRVPVAPATFCDDAATPKCEAAPSSQPGTEPLGGSQTSTRMISSDGSRIFFSTPGGTLGGGTVYMREDGTKTYQLNASEKTMPEAPKEAELWEPSADGSRAFFTTKEGLVNGDDDGESDLYMYEVGKPAGQRLTLLTVDNEPADPAGNGGTDAVVEVNASGHYVYFAAESQLVAGEPLLSYNEMGLYLWHDGQISYIGHFPNGGYIENTTRTDTGNFRYRRKSRVTPDGKELLFGSEDDNGFIGRGGFSGYDQHPGDRSVGDFCDSGCRELYLYNAETGKVVCVSCNPDGAPPVGDALVAFQTNGSGVGSGTQHITHSLSDNGRYVFFSSPDALVPEDTNGAYDVYEYEVETGEVHLLSSGTSEEGSYLADASADGSEVFFFTTKRLSGWDTDNGLDLYDARIDGGFPEPGPEIAPCAGDACRGASPPVPPVTSPASDAVQGGGNQPVERHKCPPKKQLNGKGKCVSSHHKKHHKKRRQPTQRRVGR